MKTTLILVLLLVSLNVGLTQNYSGTFIADDTDTLTLTQHADGSLSGQILSGDVPFSLQGQVSQQGALGTLSTADGTTLAFGAVFTDANTLNMQIAPVDASGQPLMDQVVELNFIRQSENPLTQVSPNPLQISPTAATSFDPTRTYSDGQTIQSVATGVSVTVPAGYTATYNVQDDVFSFSDNTRGFIVFAFSDGNLQGLTTQLIELLKQDADTQINILGTPQETQNLVRATLQVQEAIVELAVRQGPGGNLLGILGGSATQDAALVQAIDSVLNSASFSVPASVAQTVNLGGQDLSKTGTSSSFGSGINPSSLSGVDEEFYTFCSNGDYGYSMSSQTFFSSDVGSVSSEDSDQHQGNWKLVSSMSGESYLFLQASDGRSFLNRVGTSAEGLAIDNSVFSAQPSSQCQ